MPANFYTAKKISFSLGHCIKAVGVEHVFGAENLAIRREGDAGAAPVFGCTQRFQPAFGCAAFKALFVEFFVPRYFDNQKRRQGIDHRNPNPVEAAGCVIGIATKLTARMQCRHNDLKRGFIFEFWVWVDRYAAPIISDAYGVAGFYLNLDKTRMSGDSFVHGIVDDLGEQMMHGAHIGTTNIHTRAAAHRLQPFKHLDIAGCV